MPDFARYSADRLRDHSRILQPLGQGRAYRGLDLKEFWGADRPRERRLSVLGARTDPAELHDEARALLAIAADGPTTATVPRIAFGLLRVAPALAPPVVGQILELVPTALDWVEVWIKRGTVEGSEEPRRPRGAVPEPDDSSGVRARTVRARRAPAQRRHPRRGGRTAVARRHGRGTSGVPRGAEEWLPCRGSADASMRLLDPARTGWLGEPITPERLGLAIGWFAAGDEEAGFQILNAAREALFTAAQVPLHDRTALALVYAEALGFAPGVIALGRLEELFQRLGRVTVQCSSNCYYTLHPLRLIDTVVRSVVTDEFTIGATVRAWLDEDEFLIRQRVQRDMAACLRES